MIEVTNEQEAKEALAALKKYHGLPMMSIGVYCNAFNIYLKCLQELEEGHRREYHQYLTQIGIDIEKSNLLWRLLYNGQKLRTKMCPIHKGHWSGCAPEPCPEGCSNGIDITGWLPEPDDPVGSSSNLLVTVSAKSRFLNKHRRLSSAIHMFRRWLALVWDCLGDKRD